VVISFLGRFLISVTMKLGVLCVLLVGLVGALAFQKSYDGYKVFRVTAETKDHLQVLLGLRDAYEFNTEEYTPVLNFWTEPGVKVPTDIMVAKSFQNEIQDIFAKNGMKSSVLMEDVEAMIQSQWNLNQAADKGRAGWENYNRWSVVQNWMTQLRLEYPTIAEIGTLGFSGEGRDLRYMKVSTPGGHPNKQTILIDGAFHAREWISPAVVTYIMNQVVTNSSAYSDILDYVDFVLLPFANPDGYEHSHTADRMWRKTRAALNGSTCRGVDPNRNSDIDFGGSGSSTNPCAETYLGSVAFSEPETRLLSEFITQNIDKIKIYLSMHSYSQAWLTPWAWSDVPPPDFAAIMRLGQAAIDALRAEYGTQYLLGPTSTTLYFHSGAAQDWAKQAGVKYTYTPELRDQGRYGFLLPPDQIIPTCIETWAGVQAMVRLFIQDEMTP